MIWRIVERIRESIRKFLLIRAALELSSYSKTAENHVKATKLRTRYNWFIVKLISDAT
jgi:hypothetical protein